MTAKPAFGNVVLISTDHSFLHVGPPGNVPGHFGVTPTTIETIDQDSIPEMYDEQGNQLEIDELDGQLRLIQTGEKADLQLLIDRIDLALATIQVALHARTDGLQTFRMPRIHSTELHVVLGGLTRAFNMDSGGGDVQGTSHDCTHHPHRVFV